MEFKIENEGLQTAVENGAKSAVDAALSGYEFKRAVGEAISAEVVDGAIGEALRRAIGSIDTEALTKRLAEEIERNATQCVVHLITEGTFETVAKLRGLGEYSDADKAARARLREELFGSLKRVR